MAAMKHRAINSLVQTALAAGGAHLAIRALENFRLLSKSYDGSLVVNSSAARGAAFVAELFEDLREEGWVTINGAHVLIGADGQVDSAGMASGGSKDAGKAGDSTPASASSSAKVAALPRATVGEFLDPEALDHEIAPIASEQAGSIEMLLHAGGDRNMNSAIAIFKGTPEATAFLMSDGGSTNEERTAAFLTAHTDHSFSVNPDGGLLATAKSRESLRETTKFARKPETIQHNLRKRDLPAWPGH